MIDDTDLSSPLLITRIDSDGWDIPVFSAGWSGEESAIAVFTQSQLAEEYLQRRQLEVDHEVCRTNPIEFIEIVLTAARDGIGLVVVNPDAIRCSDAVRHRVIPINRVLLQHVMAIVHGANPHHL